jgi:hypothetical protein
MFILQRGFLFKLPFDVAKAWPASSLRFAA